MKNEILIKCDCCDGQGHYYINNNKMTKEQVAELMEKAYPKMWTRGMFLGWLENYAQDFHDNFCKHQWVRTTKNYKSVKKCLHCGIIKTPLNF